MKSVLRGLCACLATWVGIVGAVSAAASATSAALPQDMSFIAQEPGGTWRLFYVGSGGVPSPVSTAEEPRQACMLPGGEEGVYSASDGTLRWFSRAGGHEKVLARGDARRAYTQPCADTVSRSVVAVEMADGKSIETEILRFNPLALGAGVPVARQAGAQHEPFLHGGRWLVYAHVGCSDGCDELLVEIWMRDLLAGKARQLTLLNAFSHGPVTDGQRVVFSSNAGGAHRLWQVPLAGGAARLLTPNVPQATQPALCRGAVYFVLVRPDRMTIARLSEEGQVHEIEVPGLRSFRSLRCLA